MARPKGSWEGLETSDGDNKYLHDTKRLWPADAVAARVPGEERIPVPQEGEVMVFYDTSPTYL